ncbi:serine/threonine-protein kinase ULK3-like isoform X2 [Lycorma delicatula]|uniref:serine/threonine-protein kinase ULK3-like isoform X2 n=1 Tax=Lycorma delicatula TaxID=130591 RepID=UPI003F50DFE1
MNNNTDAGVSSSSRTDKRNSSIGDYIILETIGQGSFAVVYKACKEKDKKDVAIKCSEKSKLSQPEAIENIITEIRILKMLRHPNIVEMIEFLWDDKCIYIVEEFCDGSDLSKFIQKRQKVPERIVQKFLQQLAMGLNYLRSHNISHLDLKPANLLLVTKPRLTLKIGDFGFAKFLSDETYQGALRGSPLYMAPEMLLRRQFGAKVDLWSVGIITYECLFGKAPFASCNFKELRDKLIAETTIEIPEDCGISRQCQELLKRTLKYNPQERIDFEQFFSHPFIDIAHVPSPKTYSYAVELLHQAVKHDSKKEFKEAFNLYCDALAYLIPHVHAEKNVTRKQALQTRLAQYMDRTEALLPATKWIQPSSTPYNVLSIYLLNFMFFNFWIIYCN